MNEQLFLVWNGWGLLFTGLSTLYFFLHIFVTVKVGSGTPLRKWITPLLPVAVVCTFIYSGWVAGLLSLPIGGVLGVVFARIIIPPK